MIKVWKSVLQTPYDANTPFLYARKKIEKDFFLDGILPKIGCFQWVDIDQNGTYQEFINEQGEKVNGLYRWDFRGTFRSGYWEVELYTSLNLNAWNVC